jgi:hypothetical protein
MQPEDAIYRNYDVNTLVGDAIRETQAVNLVGNLTTLFEMNKAQPVGVDKDLGSLFRDARLLTANSLYHTTSQEMSEPYDSFMQDGVTLVSRIIHIGAHPSNTTGESMFVGSDIYMIGLLGEEQSSVSIKNCPLGILTTAEGDAVFFKIEENPNLGKMVVSKALKDGESDRVLAEEGNIDMKSLKLTVLSTEERYQVTNELEKALEFFQIDIVGSSPTA